MGILMALLIAYRAPHWLSSRTMSWAGLDVTSSVYIGIVPNVVFPIYFQRFVASGTDATAAWGLLVAVSIVVSGMAALGAAALARHVSRFRLLIVFISGLVASLLLLSLDRTVPIWFAATTFVAAQACYFALTTSYESYLPEIAPAGSVGRVSGFGWALGYVGGIAGTIFLLAALGHRLEDAGIFRATFAIVATLTAIVAIPAFAAMLWSGFADLGPPAATQDWAGMFDILRHWHNHKPVFLLLSGTMLVHSATAVVVSFTAPMLASNFGQTYHDLLWLLLLLQLLSMPTTYVSAMLSDTWSKSKPIMLVLSGWSAVLFLLAFASGAWIPWVIIAVLACCLGATNAAMRSFLAEAVQPRQSVAFFGISTFAGRMFSALGPLLFVAVSRAAGQRIALLAITAILITGGALLLAHLRHGTAMTAKTTP